MGNYSSAGAEYVSRRRADRIPLLRSPHSALAKYGERGGQIR